MKEKTIAKVYAQSFLELGKVKNIDVAKEVTNLTELINASNDLENVLFLDVFTTEEKTAVFGDIAKKANISSLIIECVNYLISEKRIGLFPLIFKEIIVIDDAEKGFLRGTIEGASDDISDEYKNQLLSMLKKYIGEKKPVLTYKKSEDMTAGYRVTVDDLQLDASVDNQLKHFKEMIIGE